MAAVGGAALEPPIGEGEERRTRGRKVLPSPVFAILKSEKEKTRVGGGGGGGSKTGNGKWNEKGRKEICFIKGGGGGGGGGK